MQPGYYQFYGEEEEREEKKRGKLPLNLVA